jgi:hypothetical protein
VRATTTCAAPQAGATRASTTSGRSATTWAAPAGKYLVDDAGHAVWLVDPGINGAYNKRPDGTEVHKFDAPKATLMSYIIKGILDRQLPWSLVLFGVMIAIVLELSGIPSLAFAVGVYLPLSSSTPILIGGMVRWLVDRARRKEIAHRTSPRSSCSPRATRAPACSWPAATSPGGAIAGIVIAFLADARRTSSRLGALAPVGARGGHLPPGPAIRDLAEAVAALGSDPNVVWCTGPVKDGGRRGHPDRGRPRPRGADRALRRLTPPPAPPVRRAPR